MLSLCSSPRLTAAVVAVATCAGAVCAPSLADAPPMTLTVNSGMFGKQVQLNPNSVSGAGVGTYFGTVTGGGGLWSLNYNFSAASAVQSATQAGTMAITNLSDSELTFNVTLSLPTAAAAEFTGLFNGSLSGALLANAGGGYLRSVESTPMWLATTDGVQIAPLFSNPVNIVRSTQGSTLMGTQTFGGSQPSLPAPDFGSHVAVTLNFILSAGDTASFSSSLGGVGVPVPAPGALALLASAGLVARRRRR
jgi:hypothetical protein